MSRRNRHHPGDKQVVSREPRDGTGPDVLRVLEQIEQHLSAIRNGDGKSEREWLTIQDAADELQVSRDTIERLIGSGKLRASEITTNKGIGQRHRYRIRRDWLDQYLLDHVAPRKLDTKRTSPRKKGNGEIDFIGD